MKKSRAGRKGVRFLILLVMVLWVISVAGVWFLYQKNIAVSFQPETYELSNEQLNNPYCGWYHTYDYSLGGEIPFEAKSVTEAVKTDNNTRLCQVQIDLGAYATGTLPAEALGQVEEILTAWSATDKQMLLGFYYSVVPETMETIYLHIEQLAPVINEHSGHIYSLQCFGTNNTDAMEGTTFFKGNELLELIQYQASMTKSDILLSVDSIQQYESLTGFLNLPSEDMAYTEILAARLGIYRHNITREISQAEKKVLGQLGNYVPMGGASGKDDFMEQQESVAIADELGKQKVSYLCGDDSPVVALWKNETYRGEDVFSGITVYDYLTTHMGYRYVIQGAEISFDNWKDQDAVMTMTLSNIGFSNAYRLFDTSILLKNSETEEVFTIPLDVDNRRWLPGEKVSVEVNLDVKSYGKGRYYVYLMMTDTKAGEVIAMGNTLSLTNNGYPIGVLEIQ